MFLCDFCHSFPEENKLQSNVTVYIVSQNYFHQQLPFLQNLNQQEVAIIIFKVICCVHESIIKGIIPFLSAQLASLISLKIQGENNIMEKHSINFHNQNFVNNSEFQHR
ncbi:hypothetical protein ACKWTF_009116 [Chironomus riparius]